MSEERQQPELIFLCGPTYRCGSTLMQRVLNAHPNILMYGEDNNIIKFGRVLYEHSRGNDEHNKEVKKQAEDFKKDPTCWQANLVPGPEFYLKAYGTFLSQVILSPDRAKIVERDIWQMEYVGIKSLFNEPADLKFIKWLLPSCKVIFCARNYGECLRSYLRQKWAGYTHDTFYNLWTKCMKCLDEAADQIDLVIDYQSEPDADKLTEQLQDILPRVIFDVEAIRKVTHKKLIFEEGAIIKEKIPSWTNYL